MVQNEYICGSCRGAGVRQTIADDVFKILEADVTVRILIHMPESLQHCSLLQTRGNSLEGTFEVIQLQEATTVYIKCTEDLPRLLIWIFC